MVTGMNLEDARNEMYEDRRGTWVTAEEHESKQQAGEMHMMRSPRVLYITLRHLELNSKATGSH